MHDHDHSPAAGRLSPSGRLAAFVGGLAVLAALAFLAGQALEPAAPSASGSERPAHSADAGHGQDEDGGPHDSDGPLAQGAGQQGAEPVRGLALAEAGLRLELDRRDRGTGTEALSFRVLDESGDPITEFDRVHARRMHLIVVRRDLTGFQHLHPEMAADGTWSAPLALADPGTYRVLADFAHAGEPVTLAEDVRVAGAADLGPLPLPASRALAEPGALPVTLEAGEPRRGRPTSLRFAVRDAGRPAALQPYLGADGHLVALREGDLAFLHVHPEEGGGRPGEVAFELSFPTAGAYRLFLQVRVGGEVRTAAFTVEVS